MEEMFSPGRKYRMLLIEASYKKKISFATEQAIASRVISYPEEDWEKIAKQLYEIVLRCKTDEEILQEVEASNL